MNDLIFGLIIFSIIVGAGWSMWFLSTSAVRIHDKLNTLKEKAKLAKTKDELQTLWEELKNVNKECWHKSFSSKVIEIKTIIETKYQNNSIIENNNLNEPECEYKLKQLLVNRLLFRGMSKTNNEIIYGNYYYDGKYHFIDKCFEHRKEVYEKSVSQFTGLTSINNEKAFYGDIISFQTTEGNEMIKKLWYCNDKQSLMVGNITYYELTQSGFIQPTKLEFEILSSGIPKESVEN